MPLLVDTALVQDIANRVLGLSASLLDTDQGPRLHGRAHLLRKRINLLLSLT